MKLNRVFFVCLAFGLAGQFTACSGSKGGPQASVLEGGAACPKVVNAVNSKKSILEKDTADLSPAELDSVKALVTELEQIALDHTEEEDFNCVIKDADGEVSDYDRNDLLQTITEMKATYGL